MGGLLDWTGSLAVLFFPGATKDSSNWTDLGRWQTQALADYSPMALFFWLWALALALALGTWAAGLAHQRLSWTRTRSSSRRRFGVLSMERRDGGFIDDLDISRYGRASQKGMYVRARVI